MTSTRQQEKKRSHYGRVGYLVATAIAEKYNIDVIFTDGGVPRCNSRNQIFLPMFTIDSEDAAVLVNGLIDHEASHAALTDWHELPDRDTKPLTAVLTNIFEDLRIERIMGRRYPGLPININRAVQVLVKRGDLGALPADAPPTTVLQIYIAYRLRATLLQQTALESFAIDAEARLRRILPKGVMVRLQALMFEAEKCQTTRDCRRLAEAIMTMLEEEAAKLPPPSGQGQGEGNGPGQGNGHGQSGSGNGQGNGQGQGGGGQGQGSNNKQAGNGPGNPQDGGAGGGGAGSGGDDGSGLNAQQQKSLQDIVNTTADQQSKGIGEMLQEQIGDMANQTPQAQRVAPAKASGVVTNAENATEIMARATRPAASLMQRVASLLQAKTLEDKRIARSGRRIDTRVLHRLKMGDPRVFQRKTEGLSVDTAVLILVDKSGSMGSSTPSGQPAIQVALDCAMAVGLGLDRIPGVVTSVGAFPARGADVAVLTRFGEKVRHTARRYPSIGASGGTPMAQALLWGVRELIMQPQPRKILLVLTDGAPDNREAVRFALKVAQDYGIETMGIGIEQDMSHLIKDSRRVNSVNELPGAMFGMLQKALMQHLSR